MSKTFILVHGAWHTNACWHLVASNLKQQGYKVHVPNLPGRGDDKREFSTIRLSDYIDCILNVIETEQNPVTLVGHSMAGVVISQIAEIVPDKIERLIYVAAFIPENNSSLVREAQQSKAPGLSPHMLFDPSENKITLRGEELRNLLFNSCVDDVAVTAISQLVSEPFSAMVTPITITEARFGRVDKMYIECLQDKTLLLEDQRRMHSKVKAKVIALDADHSPFFSKPEELSVIFIQR